MDIMKHVDILDLIEITTVVDAYGQLYIDFISKEDGKHVVVDESAIKEIQKFLETKLIGKSKTDETALGYAKEYVGKMVSELYRNGLVQLEEIKESPDDPYASHRKVDRKW